MKTPKKKRALFSPLTVSFFLLIAAVAVYGAVRYLFLQSLEPLIFEVCPAAAAVLLFYLIFSLYAKFSVRRKLSALTKKVSSLSREVSEGRPIEYFDARGEIGMLSERISVQSEELCAAFQAAKDRTARETESRLRKTLAWEIYKHTLPAKSVEGEGFGIDIRLKSAEGTCCDLLDAFLLDSHTVFFAIGDVWGRGLSAAFFVSAIRDALRAGVHAGKPLGQVVLDVNRSLYSDNKEGLAASLFAGIFSAETGELRFVNMGHVPPVVTGMYSGFLQMSCGSPLGVYENITVGEESFLCSPGQSMIFCTEGVIDARNGEGEEFGQDRLLQAVQPFISNPRKIADGILNTVGEFRAEECDDLGCLVLRFTDVPSRAAYSPSDAADKKEDSESIYRALLLKARMGR